MVSVLQAEFPDGFFPGSTHIRVHRAFRLAKLFSKFAKRRVEALSVDFEGSLSHFLTERLESLSFSGLHISLIAFRDDSRLLWEVL